MALTSHCIFEIQLNKAELNELNYIFLFMLNKHALKQKYITANNLIFLTTKLKKKIMT